GTSRSGHRGRPRPRVRVRAALGRRPDRRQGGRRRPAVAAARDHRRDVRARRHPHSRARPGPRRSGRGHRRAPQRRGAARTRRCSLLAEGVERHRHHAAARGVPASPWCRKAGGEVDHRGLRRLASRPGSVHRRHRAAAHAIGRLRQGLRGGGGLSAWLLPSPPRRRRDHLPHGEPAVDPVGHPDGSLLPAAGAADGAGLRPAAAVPARGRRVRGAAPGDRAGAHGHLQRRRRRHHAAVAGRTPHRHAEHRGALLRLLRCRRQARPRGRIRRPRRRAPADIRTRGGHHRAAHRLRLPAGLVDRRHARRLRTRTRTRPADQGHRTRGRRLAGGSSPCL
ncbi:MAG: UDP-glucose 4-epimerase, partial [uncultured Nocardioidaceae bacterium]